MRTAQVAGRVGYSVQQVRNLARDGVLPPVRRTDSGYRRYGEVHVRAALAYRALATAVGPVDAKSFVRAMHEQPVPRVLALFDHAHAALDRERDDLRRTLAAVTTISAEPIAPAQARDSMSVAELATALGVRTSTLRHWDTEGLVVPDRVAAQGIRRYWPTDVRDARIVHQLRAAGYRIDALRTLMPQVRAAGRLDQLAAALATRDTALTVRSRALLEAAAEFVALLALVEDDDRDGESPVNAAASTR
ncbi:MerR family transcriptional regulator [Nocardia callitridis]